MRRAPAKGLRNAKRDRRRGPRDPDAAALGGDEKARGEGQGFGASPRIFESARKAFFGSRARADFIVVMALRRGPEGAEIEQQIAAFDHGGGAYFCQSLPDDLLEGVAGAFSQPGDVAGAIEDAVDRVSRAAPKLRSIIDCFKPPRKTG